MGLIFSYYANNDKVHRYLRNKNITKETSFPSEWFGSFKLYEESSTVVLHLQDTRRLYGSVTEVPSDPKNGYFLISYPCWLDGAKEIPITGVKNILINSNDVKWIEFVGNEQENKNV
jgi:hypothetical protein